MTFTDLIPASAVFLTAETPLKVDLYLYMRLNKNVVLYKRKGEILNVQEVLGLTRSDSTSKPMVRKDAQEDGMKGVFAGIAEDIDQQGNIGPGVKKFAGEMMKSLGASSDLTPISESFACARGILDDTSQLVSEIISQYKNITSTKVFQQFVSGLDKSGDRLDVHNRHVSALSVLMLLSIGGSTAEELSDLAFAGRVHDMCLREIPEIFYERHLNGEDLGLVAAGGLYINSISDVYRAHIEKVLAKLKASPYAVSPGVIKTVEQHHENRDGSGLYGFPGTKIYRLAKILRIADDMIALMNSETDPHTVDQAIKKLQTINSSSGNKIYDPSLLFVITKRFSG